MIVKSGPLRLLPNFSRIVFPALAFICVSLTTTLIQAALVDSWRASDLLGSLNNGDAVASWSSTAGRALTATSASGLQPLFYLNTTPAGGPAVRFDQDRLRRTDNSPVAGLTSFSMAVVFRVNGAGAGGQTQWYNNTGLVDAEQGGVTADWGTAIASDVCVCKSVAR